MILEVKVGELKSLESAVGNENGERRLEIEKTGSVWKCRLDGEAVAIDAVLTRPNVLSLIVEGKSFEIKRDQNGAGFNIWIGDTGFSAESRDPRALRARLKAGADKKGPAKIVAPMPGRVVRVLVKENDEVEAGQGILVVEAMKMQNEIKSPKKGVVKKLSTAPGTAVNPGDVLATVE